MDTNHPARILAIIRQITEAELTPQEIEALLKRHADRDRTSSQIIAAAARIILAKEH